MKVCFRHINISEIVNSRFPVFIFTSIVSKKSIFLSSVQIILKTIKFFVIVCAISCLSCNNEDDELP